MPDDARSQTTEIGEGGIECVPLSELHGIDAAIAAERARCSAWARLYYDGDLADDYEMYVGIRDGLAPPEHLKGTAP